MADQGKTRLRLVCFLITAAVVLFLYHNIIFHLNDFTFGLDGDALKNYYFVKYYINDAGAVHNQFRGMNYPFDENLNYLDAQPLLTIIFKFINLHIANTGDAFVSVTYILFFISIIATSLLLLEIFFEYGINTWHAILFASGITLLSPQIQRITFHIYLSYIFVLPASWLLFLKFKNNRKIKYAVALVCFIVVAGFLHPYYTALCTAMIFLLVFFENKFSNPEKLKYVFAFAVLPLIVFKLLLNTGYQGGNDFGQHPYGAFGEAYRSRPEDVFFPNEASSWNNILHLKWIAHSGYEGEAFIGWALTFTAIAYIIYMIYKIITGKYFSEFNPFKTLTVLFFSACIIFIFSTGTLHFILPSKVQNIFPAFITQFRTYGRLAWICYYLLSVFFSMMFYRFLKSLPSIKWRILFLSLFILLCIADIAEMNQRVVQLFDERKIERADSSYLPLLFGLTPSDYQAIISLPYFHLISSVEGERGPQRQQMWSAFQLSLHTGLPLTDTYSSRSSQKNAIAQLDFFSGKNKNILQYYHDKRPLLIIVSRGDKEKIINHSLEKEEYYIEEIKILDHAKLLKQERNLLLYEIKFEELLKL